MNEHSGKSSAQKPFAFPNSWGESDNSILLATTFTLHRNIHKFLFSHKLDIAHLETIGDLLQDICLKIIFKESETFSACFLDECSPFEREYLTEHFLLPETITEKGSGSRILFDTNTPISVCINFLDHLLLHCVDTSGEIEKKLEKLILVEQEIEKKISFAYTEHFGFLTSDATKSGTGLQVRAYLHLPALMLTETFEKAVSEELQQSVDVAGIQGSKDNYIGNIAVLLNRYTNGVTEEMITSSIRSEITKLVRHEQMMREKIIKEKDIRIIDAISRALGTLKHSYYLDTTEAFQLLSMIKFGLELGCIRSLEPSQINMLFLQCRRSHILSEVPERLRDACIADQRVVYETRAQFLRSKAEKFILKVDD